MKRHLVSVLLLPLLGLASTVMGGNPLGGLSVALSPDNNTLVAAGDNRVLYVMNPESVEVADRVWLGTCIVKLDFNEDGSMLLAEDSAGTLFLIDAKTWEVAKNLPKAEKVSAARGVNTAAALNPDYNGHQIRILDMTDLSEKGVSPSRRGRR